VTPDPAPGRDRRRVWRALVPVTAVLAGLLFAASAHTAQGTDLRAGRFSDLTGLIEATSKAVHGQEQDAAALRKQVEAETAGAAQSSSTVAVERARGDALLGPAGLEPVRGPGLTVSLDDAPTRPGQAPASDNPDDLVVHQQDVQSVINALWSGGAEAMTLMGERIVSTSAVRCVGNTLLVQGRLIGPPFVIKAIGPVQAMRAAFDVEPGVVLFRHYVDDFGLRFDVMNSSTLHLPAYTGPLDLPHTSAR